MALKIDLKTLPGYVKTIIAILPAVIIIVLVMMLAIKPKQKEIAALDKKIDEQNNQIAVSTSKAARLDVLIKENEKLIARLNELKEQLPDEKEISSLLKQVSDLSIGSGLEMKSWKPGPKTKHPSGIVYEIPVAVSVIGIYHDLGNFLGSLTRLNRIVNVNNIQLGTAKSDKGLTNLTIAFTASTFSALSEEEMAKPQTGQKGQAQKAPVRK